MLYKHKDYTLGFKYVLNTNNPLYEDIKSGKNMSNIYIIN